MNWKLFKQFFVGNVNAYAIQKKDGSWTVIKNKITKGVIDSHLNRTITMGSYCLYSQHKVDRCRWLCIDLDIHPTFLENDIKISNSNQIDSITFPIRLWNKSLKKPKKTTFNTKKELLKYYWSKSGIIIHEIIEVKGKQLKKELYRIEANEYNKLEILSKNLYNFLVMFYDIKKTDICREHSGRGYHIWIKLEDLTTLKRAWDFREDIKEKIMAFFGYECELFPKQKSSKGLVKGLGNFVKLPYSINRNTNTLCKVLDGFSVKNQTDGFKITKIIGEIREEKRMERKRDKALTELDLSNWKPLDYLDDSKFYEKLRPCMKALVRGRPAVGGFGHDVRRNLANELFKLKAPLECRIMAFKNQPDFTYEKSRFQVLDLEMRAVKNNRFFVSSCQTIAEWGFCLPNCPMRHRAKVDLTDEEIQLLFQETNEIGVKGGWKAVRDLIREKVNNGEKSKEYVIKTTRSGTTTNIIVESLENDKKILVIAPTIKICEVTVKYALTLTSKEPKLFRFGSNTDLCLNLFDKTSRVPDLKRFPFLLKDNCRFCEYAKMIPCIEHSRFDPNCEYCIKASRDREKCNWRRAIEDLDEYDIIYITTAKIHALTKTTDGEARVILNSIFNAVDVIFLDEVSEVLDVGAGGITFYAKPDNVYKLLSPEVQFDRRFRHEYEMIREFIESNLNRNQKKIWFALYDFVKAIVRIHKQWKSLRQNNLFLRLDSPLYEVLRKVDRWYVQHNKMGSGDRDWLEIYKTLVDYTEQTDYYPDSVVKILILSKFPQFYIQYTNPIRYELQMDVLPAKPIAEFLTFLNNISEKKQFFTTDATEPPIPISRLFPNIIELIINDPMDTAKIQTVYPDKFNINISQPRYLEKHLLDVIEFIKLCGNSNTMIVAQNIYTASRLRKNLVKGKDFHTLTYFRSPLTIGTPSDCRTIITIGTPYPPKNSHRWLADLFMKEELVEEGKFDINSLTKHLEYYNAKSVFFQAISRGKDPKGITPSKVYCYGLNIYQTKQLLKFPIATPKIEKQQTIREIIESA